jgi:hypothetical protein
MQRLLLAAVAGCLFASVAAAQSVSPTSEPAQNGPSNAAVKSRHENNAMNPVAGANSFTASQAKAAIEAKGYSNVSKLKKDKNGVWRGTATKDGQAGPISVDYQGNVN